MPNQIMIPVKKLWRLAMVLLFGAIAVTLINRFGPVWRYMLGSRIRNVERHLRQEGDTKNSRVHDWRNGLVIQERAYHKNNKDFKKAEDRFIEDMVKLQMRKGYHHNPLEVPPWLGFNFTFSKANSLVAGRFRGEPIWDVSSKGDRILQQLDYVPKGLGSRSRRPIQILSYTGLEGMGATPGGEIFQRSRCNVHNCHLHSDLDLMNKSDAVIFANWFEPTASEVAGKSKRQVWILYSLESPQNTADIFSAHAHLVNWTATYRRDSTIVTPYAKWVPYKKRLRKKMIKNYAKGKEKKIAWFASNCQTSNERLDFALKLSRHMQVDIYGECGTLECPRAVKECFSMLKNYKFYLSFENSNCRDYITEKFFTNALQYDTLPIVMGAPKEDYSRVAPPHSFIHVDDFSSPRDLAEYLHKLDKDDALYNEYFRWKGEGKFIDTKFWCRLCAMLNERRHQTWIRDINKWWRGEGVCNNGKWNNRSTR